MMSTWGILLKDPLFLAAFLVFVGTCAVLAWTLVQLKKPGRPSLPSRPSAAPASARPAHDPDAIPRAVEERLNELAVRLAAVEQNAPARAALETLDKRLASLEDEVEKLKLFLSDMPAPAPAADPTAAVQSLTRRVDALQKVLESLSLAEAPKA
jgi:hypothetical protein